MTENEIIPASTEQTAEPTDERAAKAVVTVINEIDESEISEEICEVFNEEGDPCHDFGNSDYLDDVSELCASFPEFYSSLSGGINEMNDYAKYCKMRGKGLTPTEAFYATNGESVAKLRLEAMKKKQQSLQKSHVRSAIAETELSHSVMTEAQKRHARASLGVSISDSELERLWRRSQNK